MILINTSTPEDLTFLFDGRCYYLDVRFYTDEDVYEITFRAVESYPISVNENTGSTIMKATITFDLPEEQEEYNTHVQANAMRSALWRIENDILRAYTKYGATQSFPEINDAKTPVDLMQALRDAFYEVVNDEGIEL